MPGPRVVVIGAGVVGAALADELTARGWDDITVVDQGACRRPAARPRTRPGWCSRPTASKTMTELARYTVEKLGAPSTDLLPAGRRAGGRHHPRPRLAELHRRHGWLTSWGVEARPARRRRDVRSSYPLLDPDVVLGGLYTPTDGLAKAVRAVDAQRRRAAARGVTAADRGTRCSTSRVEDGRVTGVVTDQGELPADIVVCCAGIWGPKVAGDGRDDAAADPAGAPARLDRAACPALAGQTREAVRPILRHQDADLYYRERFDTLGIGYYGHRPMPVDADDIGRVDRRRGHAVGAGVHRGGLRRGLAADPGRCCRRPADAKVERGHQRPVLLHHRQHAAARRVP